MRESTCTVVRTYQNNGENSASAIFASPEHAIWFAHYLTQQAGVSGSRVSVQNEAPRGREVLPSRAAMVEDSLPRCECCGELTESMGFECKACGSMVCDQCVGVMMGGDKDPLLVLCVDCAPLAVREAVS